MRQMMICGAKKALGNDLHAARTWPRIRRNLARVRRDRRGFRFRHGRNPPSWRRIFPEARDPKSKPLTQGRRQARRQHVSGRDFGGVSDAADDPADDADDRKATSARDRTGQVSKREAAASRATARDPPSFPMGEAVPGCLSTRGASSAPRYAARRFGRSRSICRQSARPDAIEPARDSRRRSVDLVLGHDPGLPQRRLAPFHEGRQAQHGTAVGGADLIEVDAVRVSMPECGWRGTSSE